MNPLFEKLKKVVSRYMQTTPDAPKTFVDPDNPSNSEHQTWRTFVDDALQRNAEDRIKYQDYDLMDSEIPEISTGLDVIADFVVYPDNVSKSATFKVTSPDRAVQKGIDDINAVTRFPYEFHSIMRETCKYGDNVEELLKNEQHKVMLGFRNIPIQSVVVNVENGIVNKDQMIKQFGNDSKPIATLSDQECLHFCIPTNRQRHSITGKGVSKIEKARLIYRQLRLMEEGVMISRLSRANQQYGIIVDVGELYGDEVFNYLDKYKKRLQRRKYIDPSTGRVSYKYNPLSVMEDLLVPTRQGSGSNIVPLNNSTSSGKQIEDVNYFQDKMIYAVGVPKLLIGKEADVNSKSTSDMQYICFLRGIRQLQTMSEPEIIRFYRVALKYQGVPNWDTATIEVEWPSLGTIDEERKWRIEQMKSQVGIGLLNIQMIDDLFFYQNYMDMSEKQAKELIDRLDAEQEEVTAEIDDQMKDAIDLTRPADSGMIPGQKNLPNDNTAVVKAKKGIKAAKAKITPKEAMEFFKANMPKEQYERFEKFVGLLEANPSLKKNFIEYLELSKIKLGG